MNGKSQSIRISRYIRNFYSDKTRIKIKLRGGIMSEYKLQKQNKPLIGDLIHENLVGTVKT
jgi:hypothetical protein